jgi:hypothetical protein
MFKKTEIQTPDFFFEDDWNKKYKHRKTKRTYGWLLKCAINQTHVNEYSETTKLAVPRG